MEIPILVLIILAFLAFPSHCSYQNDVVSALFVFGDSLFDAGNNNNINTSTQLQANFPPYGESFFNNPTGRFCDGRIIPDFIAEFAKLPLIPPFVGYNGNIQLSFHGLNFASGGAGALEETFQGLAISLKAQLKFFKKAVKDLGKKIGKKEAQKVVSNAVYFFNVGGNDYLFPLSSNSTLFTSNSPQQYVSMVVGNITQAIKGIYDQGGRKFAIINQGPLGCLPGLRAANLTAGGDGGCLEVASGFSVLHNVLLSQQLQYLNENLCGFKYSYFDFFSAALRILANPLQNGFNEVKSACCGSGPLRGEDSCGGKRGISQFELCDDPGRHLFFDANHPTEAANLLISKIMWAGPSDLVGPYNLQALFQLDL